MPLKKLTNLERKQVDIEMQELLEKKKYLSNLLNNRSLLLETLIEKFDGVIIEDNQWVVDGSKGNRYYDSTKNTLFKAI